MTLPEARPEHGTPDDACGRSDVTWDAAWERAYRAAGPLAPVARPLPQALGGVLAGPLVALAPSPSFSCAAMDGYAVRGDPPWTVVGRVRAGQPAPPALEPGSAWEIATGAPVPEGTGAVLPYEHALRLGGQVTGDVTPGGHVRRTGEETRSGDVLAPAGTVVTPQLLGLAAALGHDCLDVHPAPRVAAVVTGDELTTRGAPGDGRVRDAIGPMLPGLVAALGGTLTQATYVPDGEEPLAEVLGAAADEAGADVVLVSGSSSAGPADHLRRCLASLGAALVVDGVACRPGHPQSLALLPDGRLVVGLPGNPLAALVSLLTLAQPVLAAQRGLPLPALDTAVWPADRHPDVRPHPTSTRLVPVVLRDGVATPLAHAGSAMLRGVASADALAVLGPSPAPPAADGRVRLLRLPTG